MAVKKIKIENNETSEKELGDEIDRINVKDEMHDELKIPVRVTASKPISELKKGDRIQIDGKEYMIDAHEMLIDHGNTKEMAIEMYDTEDRDYQLRYFDDQVEKTIELYELQEILYVKKLMKNIIW